MHKAALMPPDVGTTIKNTLKATTSATSVENHSRLYMS